MQFTRLVGRAALVVLASAFAASLLPLAPLAAQVAVAERSARPEVMRLEFEGVSDAVDLDDLATNISTTASHCKSALYLPFCKLTRIAAFKDRHHLDHKELARDVLRIRVWYYRHGFREAQADTTVTWLEDDKVAITFRIVEGPPTIVTDATVRADSALLSPDRVDELMLLKAGERLDLFKLDSTRVFFQNALWELGYADALVDTSSVVNAAAHTARVQVVLVPNYRTTIGEITIRGLDEIDTSTVRNTLGFRPGDLYRRSTVLESQRNLYESNLFRVATIDVPATFDSVKAVTVTVREAPLHEARVSAGFNTTNFLQTDGRYTAYNLLGGARRLDAQVTFGNLLARSLNDRGIFHGYEIANFDGITGNGADFLQPTWQASVRLQQPAFLQRPKNTFGVGVFAHRRSVPGVVIDRGYGADATFTRSLARRTPASITYRFEETLVEANGPYFCINFGVCESTTIDALRNHNRLSPITATVFTDRSDQPLAPTRGYTARATLEHAAGYTASDYKYTRGFADAALYTRLGTPSSVLAFHLRLGIVKPMAGDGVLHPRNRFYAGGASSVRGYGENQLGPRILTLPRVFFTNAVTLAGAPCDINSLAIRECDPNTVRDTIGTDLAKDVVFTPRPIGGTSLLEGSVEYRFRLPFLDNLGGAVFLDGASVGEKVLDPLGGGLSSFADLVSGKTSVTPGFGIRYYSPIGAIRVDLGYNPSRVEELAVVTEIDVNGRAEVVPLQTTRRYDPLSGRSGLKNLLNRLTLHLSIGEAY